MRPGQSGQKPDPGDRVTERTKMKIDQLEKLLTGKTISDVMKLIKIANDPILMVSSGLDFTNVRVQTIGGAVRFGLWESTDAMCDPNKFATGYVTFVNGEMSPLYLFTEEDFKQLEKQHPAEAVAGLRNQKVICATQPAAQG